jgi:hypothetical protein
MAIDSTSSLADVKAAYYDSADYDIDASDTGKCKLFIVACRQLLLRLNKRAAHGGRSEEVEIDPGVLERQIADAKRWLFVQNKNDNGGSTTRVFSRGEQFAPQYPGPYYG